MAEPDITVIIPAYNPDAADLQRAIDSAWTNRRVRRVLVVDDGSTEPVNVYGAEVIFALHRGVVATRNTGLAQVPHGWVVNCDQDDEYAPGSLDALRDAVSSADQYAYGNTEYVLQGRTHRPGRWHPGMNVELFGTLYGVLWNIANPMRYWQPGNWPNYPYNDWDLVLQLESRGVRGVYVDVTTLRYTYRDSGLSGTFTEGDHARALEQLSARWQWEA